MTQNIVNLLGAGSGIDTLTLVNQLVEVEKAAPQERIDNKRLKAETQISDFGLLSSALSTLQDASALMGDSDTFNTKSASFSDSTAFTPVSLDTNVQTGDYAFTVSQLAQAQSLSSTAFSSADDEVGEGVITFSFGNWDVATPPADPTLFTEDTANSSASITIDASNNSLSGLAEAINDADFGVQASVINDGTNYRLVILAESGFNNQLQMTVSESGASPSNNDDTGLSRFSFNDSNFQMTQNQVGQDATFTVNGLSVSRESNTINDVIEGFEYTLLDTTETGETVNVTIEDDKTSGEQAVRDFIEAYNLFLEAVEPLIGKNEETNEFGSLKNDSLAERIPAQIRALLVDAVPGLSSNGTFSTLGEVGIRTELDGTISIEEDTFTDAIDDNFDAFKSLFIPVTESDTNQITVNSYGVNTLSGEYEVVITTPPSKGSLVGTTVGASLLTDLAADVPTSAELTGAAVTAELSDFEASSGNFVGSTASIPLDLLTQGTGANDYDFSITVDGVTSAADISVVVADYASYNDLATALQTAINADTNISGVTVNFDNNQFTFSSGTTGASSSVTLSAVGANANELGINGGVTNAGTGGANDYDFTIEVDGITSDTISLMPNTYSSFDDLATEMQTQINADATLSGSGVSVSVAHNGSEFVITSDSTGVSSTIANATAVGSEVATLGITSGSTTQGAATGGNTTEFDFTITLDGNTSGTISLDTGSYADLDAVAEEIEAQINADQTLATQGSAVDVTYDSDADSFTIISRRYGSSSNVSITDVGGSTVDLGLSAGTSSAGVNVVGTINGVTGFGSGNVLLPALGEDAESLALVIGENATSGTVNFSRGFGDELELLIEKFLQSSGVISLREDSLEGDVEDLDDDQDRLDRRIEAYQERLTSQFIAMEAIVRSLQDSSSFLQTTLDSLLNANNGD